MILKYHNWYWFLRKLFFYKNKTKIKKVRKRSIDIYYKTNTLKFTKPGKKGTWVYLRTD